MVLSYTISEIYDDLKAENRNFSIPQLFGVPLLRVCRFGFLDEPYFAKTRVLRLYESVSGPCDPSFRHYDTISASDRRQTDIPTTSNIALAWFAMLTAFKKKRTSAKLFGTPKSWGIFKDTFV